MDENLISTQDTIPEEENAAAEAAENEQENIEVPEESNDGAEEKPAEQDEGALLPGISIKFNKKNIDLSHEEAVTYAQKGMKYDQISEEYSLLHKHSTDLKELIDHAGRSGKSLSEFVEGIKEAEINVIRQQCKETAGGNEEYEQLLFDKALKERNLKLQEYNDSIASKEKEEQESFEKSLADAVISINKINPDITDVTQIPESVIKTAQKDGISIREAYLLNEYAERKAVEAAEKAEKSAKEKSSGSLKDDANDTDTGTAAFLKGLWS